MAWIGPLIGIMTLFGLLFLMNGKKYIKTIDDLTIHELGSLLCKVVNTNSLFINEAKVRDFSKDLVISYTGSEDYVILEPYVEREKACMM